MAKHYYSDNYIIDGYSDELNPEKYDIKDICINEFGIRQFTEDLLTSDGRPKYKYVDGQKVESEKPKVLTIDDINNQVISKIRELYSDNEEYKCLRLGISDNQNAEYLAYKVYVELCVSWGAVKKEDL
jgi:hypothetical protein